MMRRDEFELASKIFNCENVHASLRDRNVPCHIAVESQLHDKQVTGIPLEYLPPEPFNGSLGMSDILFITYSAVFTGHATPFESSPRDPIYPKAELLTGIGNRDALREYMVYEFFVNRFTSHRDHYSFESLPRLIPWMALVAHWIRMITRGDANAHLEPGFASIDYRDFPGRTLEQRKKAFEDFVQAEIEDVAHTTLVRCKVARTHHAIDAQRECMDKWLRSTIELFQGKHIVLLGSRVRQQRDYIDQLFMFKKRKPQIWDMYMPIGEYYLKNGQQFLLKQKLQRR